MKFVCLFTFTLILIQGARLTDVPTTKLDSTFAGPSTSNKRIRTTSAQSSRNINYKDFKTINELVSNRPHNRRINATKNYMSAFSAHPEVQAINLHQEDKAQLAKELFKLRDFKQSGFWQRNLTFTIQRLLRDANVDENTIKNIIGYHFAQRSRKADLRRREKNSMIDPEWKRKQNQTQKQIHARNGNMRRVSMQSRDHFFQKLTELVEQYPNRLSAMQVIDLAETLRPMIPQERIFQPALKAYLRLNQYSSEEITMTQGSRSFQREQGKVYGKSAKRRQAEKSRRAAGTVSIEDQSQVVTPPASSFLEIHDKGKGKVVDTATPSQATMTEVHSKQQPGNKPMHHDYQVDRLGYGEWWENGCFD